MTEKVVVESKDSMRNGVKRQHDSRLLPSRGLAAGLILLAAPVFALENMQDDQLAQVNGQDGITTTFVTSNAGISAGAVNIKADWGNATYQGIYAINNFRLQGKSNLQSATVGDAPVTVINTLDWGASGTNSPGVSYDLSIPNPFRLTTGQPGAGNGLSLGGTRYFGTFAIEAASARMTLRNNNGLFNSTATDTYLLGQVTNGTLYYRQAWNAHSYLTYDNLDLMWEIPKGTLGIVKSPVTGSNTIGILMASRDGSNTGGYFTANNVPAPITSTSETDRLINIKLNYDWKYRFPCCTVTDSDYQVEFVPDNPNAAPFLNFAWLGSLKDARLVWGPGGAWSSTASQTDQSGRPGGIRLESRWSFVSRADATALGDSTKEFRWRFAEAATNGIGIELSDWMPLPGNQYEQSFPLIALDVIPAGQGPGGDVGLCWGSADNGTTGACTNATDASGKATQLLNLKSGIVRGYGSDATKIDANNLTSLALIVRDGNLLAYSSKLNIMTGSTLKRSMDWALIYTLANIDGNIYFYPGSSPSDVANGSHNYGFVMDINLRSQSLDGNGKQSWGTGSWTASDKANLWNKGTQFMIGDTKACSAAGGPISCAAGETGMGIGLIGSNVLLIANDTRFWVKNGTPGDPHDAGVDLLTPQMRIEVKGSFGGGTIPNATKIVRGGLVDVNVEGLLNFRISPADPNCATVHTCYVGYSMAARMYDITTYNAADGNVLASGSGTYIALAELNRPDMPFYLGGITGDFAITNGKAELRASTYDADGYDKLRISNNIQFGTTANARMLDGVTDFVIPGGTTAQPFAINTVALGTNSMGSVVIPSGQWAFSMTLRPQTP